MPKRKWTDEQRKAAGERLRAAKNKKQGTNTADGEVKVAPAQRADNPEIIENDVPTTVSRDDDIAELKRRFEEMAETNALLKAALLGNKQEGATVSQQGAVVGSVERYITDPSYYPDPRERLAKEPRLQRFAFDVNYELAWQIITPPAYTTLDNVRMREPRFILELNRIILDDDTGEPTPGRYTVCRLYLHEDPDAAIIIAREQGLDVDETNQKAFLDEMRYIRMRDWLIEAFYPSKASAPQQNKRDMSIGGKIVQYFEVSSEDAGKIPFDQLKTKI